MPILLRDFETRSTLNITKVGAWRYATHPDTDVLCCAYCVDDGPVQLWIPGDPVPTEWIEASSDPAWIVSAFNNYFERNIEAHIMALRYGWPTIPIERHRCLQASALSLALPAKLETVAKALGLEHEKDTAGHRNMMELSKPRKPRKSRKDDPGEPPDGLYWHEDPAWFDRLYDYCKQDVKTERDLYARVGFLSAEEQIIWELDSTINDRGIFIDDTLAIAAIKIDESAHQEINAELAKITNNQITSLGQTVKLIVWLKDHDCEVEDIQKETIRQALTRKDIPPEARRVLELRREGAHAAANKFEAMMKWRNPDGRVRGCFRYHGASTGRWASLGIQLQNLKKTPPDADMSEAISGVMTGNLAALRKAYPDNPLSVVGDTARAALCAAPGHRLIDSDFSGVESRVLAWLSGERSKLDQWTKFDQTGKPEDEPYLILGLAFGLPKKTARDKGKVGDLAFGYMGAIGAYRRFSPDDPATDADIQRYQKSWRIAHPKTELFWGDINRAAIEAVRHPGKVYDVNPRISFKCDGDFLRMRLPSGRELAYPFPKVIVTDRDDYAVVYKDNASGKWVDCRKGLGAYGGTWTENAVQAVARDLFAEAMVRLEAAGYPIVLHVHDEIVAEVPTDSDTADDFKRIITANPAWATRLPIASKVRVSERFCKIKPAVADGPREAHGPDPEISPDQDNTYTPQPNTGNSACEDEDAFIGDHNTACYTAPLLDQFCDAIADAGLTPPKSVIADGDLHRFSSDGRPRDDAGWYVLHADGIPSGVFGCWRAGIKVTWQADPGRKLTADEIAVNERLISEAGRKREEEERKNREGARQRATMIWEHASEAPADHPYLVKKDVEPHGLKVHAGELVVPMRDAAGTLHSLQFIDPDGGKQFLRYGRKKGCFHVIGKPNGELCLAEGFATGATLLEDTGRAVAICFDAGNLPPAARDLSAKFSGLRFVVCADNDYGTPGNPGLTRAHEAAAILDGDVAIPDFGADRPNGATDFNDLHRYAGAVAVKDCVDRAGAGAEKNVEPSSEKPKKERTKFIVLDDFRAYMPMHNYIYIPTREPWPASSVDSRIPAVQLYDKDGNAMLDDQGRLKKIKASAWLDKHRPVEQMTWAPGLPMIIRDRVVSEGGWVPDRGATCFNVYRPPDLKLGNAAESGPWIDHVNKIYPDSADHIIDWLAQRVQFPAIKVNHSIVLGGLQGIGKDTLLEPVKRAVGPWNFAEVSPVQLIGRFNAFLRSVILRISEARDLGETDRFKFYDHTKAFMAAPPDVLRVDEKHLREYAILNCMGVVITTNHKTDGIYLPADDRRHYVAWSDLTKHDFPDQYWINLWGWYEAGGYGHVAAYLKERDISEFDPKAPPPKTEAFWAIANANRAPEESELADVLDDLKNPEVTTLNKLLAAATGEIAIWLSDRKNRRTLPYRLEECGYVPVRNPDAKDGLWKIAGARQAVYGDGTKSVGERLKAAQKLMGEK